ncbi:unnamed protein product [Cyprideis torosa]|uniref:Uncharacterized protein n=1 Tax=Cyprideis torosa TaxID=163714 RepID=A0A7R8WFF0_9CRUS|nr:unnamed protein product [Cyprideis torosa]CAG0896881.1 unnamed protein product [Cyprideis torosa]
MEENGILKLPYKWIPGLFEMEREKRTDLERKLKENLELGIQRQEQLERQRKTVSSLESDLKKEMLNVQEKDEILLKKDAEIQKLESDLKKERLNVQERDEPILEKDAEIQKLEQANTSVLLKNSLTYMGELNRVDVTILSLTGTSVRPATEEGGGHGLLGPVLVEYNQHVDSSNDMRIINGENAYLGQFPHQMSLRYTWNDEHFCGGSIISKYWVVTAAHCVEGLTMTIFDFALLFVSPSFQFSASLNRIPVGNGYPSGLKCFASGWGRISQTPNNTTPSEYLQFIKVDPLTDDECKTKASYLDDYGVQLCTMGTGVSACYGDSGGPLTCLKNGTPQLYGIASYVYSIDNNVNYERHVHFRCAGDLEPRAHATSTSDTKEMVEIKPVVVHHDLLRKGYLRDVYLPLPATTSLPEDIPSQTTTERATEASSTAPNNMESRESSSENDENEDDMAIPPPFPLLRTDRRRIIARTSRALQGVTRTIMEAIPDLITSVRPPSPRGTRILNGQTKIPFALGQDWDLSVQIGPVKTVATFDPRLEDNFIDSSFAASLDAGGFISSYENFHPPLVYHPLSAAQTFSSNMSYSRHRERPREETEWSSASVGSYKPMDATSSKPFARKLFFSKGKGIGKATRKQARAAETERAEYFKKLESTDHNPEYYFCIGHTASCTPPTSAELASLRKLGQLWYMGRAECRPVVSLRRTIMETLPDLINSALPPSPSNTRILNGRTQYPFTLGQDWKLPVQIGPVKTVATFDPRLEDNYIDSSFAASLDAGGFISSYENFHPPLI